MRLIILLLVFLGHNSAIWSAFGCKSSSYNVDRWDETSPPSVACDCACTHILDEKGTCALCGHYGLPERGQITKTLNKSNLLNIQ